MKESGGYSERDALVIADESSFSSLEYPFRNAYVIESDSDDLDLSHLEGPFGILLIDHSSKSIDAIGSIANAVIPILGSDAEIMVGLGRLPAVGAGTPSRPEHWGRLAWGGLNSLGGRMFAMLRVTETARDGGPDIAGRLASAAEALRELGAQASLAGDPRVRSLEEVLARYKAREQELLDRIERQHAEPEGPGQEPAPGQAAERLATEPPAAPAVQTQTRPRRGRVPRLVTAGGAAIVVGAALTGAYVLLSRFLTADFGGQLMMFLVLVLIAMYIAFAVRRADGKVQRVTDRLHRQDLRLQAIERRTEGALSALHGDQGRVKEMLETARRSQEVQRSLADTVEEMRREVGALSARSTEERATQVAAIDRMRVELAELRDRLAD